MAAQRMLVTGAAGMVGSYVSTVFNGFDLTLTDIEEGFERLDVRDPQAVMYTVCELEPQVVLHLAAATDVDLCEQDPDWAYHTNTIGTQNVALACQETGCLLIFISTAGVFWGDKPEPYTEFDSPRPRNIYGDSKWQGEQIVTALLKRFFICRAGWMVGGGERDKKFVRKITQLILDGSHHVKVVDDKFGSPTYAKDLLCGILRLIGTRYYGLYHMVNTGTASRYEVALAVRGILGREDMEIEPVSSAYFPLPAPRARSEGMRNYKLDLLGMNDARCWEEALEEYMLSELLPNLRASRSKDWPSGRPSRRAPRHPSVAATAQTV